MLENFTFPQILVLTGFISIILIIFLWYIRKIFSDSNVSFDLKSGILSGLPDISLKQNDKKDSMKEQWDKRRKFVSDVSLIIKEIVDYEKRKRYLDLTEKFETQLNSANDYIEKERGLLRKLFLDLLDKRLRKNKKDVGNIASHNDSIIFELVINYIYYETYNIIRKVVHEEEYIKADINSIAFKEYVDNKIQGIINSENDILNKYYVCYKYVSRTDIYKIYRNNEHIIRNILRDMFYDMKQNNDKYMKEINNITNKINNYLIDYFKRGISLTIE